MANDQRAVVEKQSQLPREHPTLAFSAPVLSAYHTTLMSGAAEAARENDANLLVFRCGEVRDPREFAHQANILYALISRDNVDGLIFHATGVANFVGLEVVQELVKGYRLPAVCFGAVPDLPSIIVDGESGMRELVTHLIEVHHYRKIAFIRGPQGNRAAEARYRAYAESMDRHNIQLDLQLDIPPQTWGVGKEAVRLLLDERKLQPGTDLQAIVAPGDDAAIQALKALEARGIQVPRDVAVAGFDDMKICRAATPPLSTVRNPVAAEARWAVETILAQLKGEAVPEQYLVPTHAVIRESCGCESKAVIRAGQLPPSVLWPKGPRVFLTQRAKLIGEMVAGMNGQGEDVAHLAGELIDGLQAELQGEKGAFLQKLKDGLRLVMATGGDVAGWQAALSVLQQQALPHLNGLLAKQLAAILTAARVAIGEIAVSAELNTLATVEGQATALWQLGAQLGTAFEVRTLVDVLASGLPRLGIPSAYLALYENPQPYAFPDPVPAQAYMHLAYTERGRVSLEEGGRRFKTSAVVPPDLWPQGRRYTCVVEPLYFRDSQFGYLVMEIGPTDGAVYDNLRMLISSALKGALLVEERELLLTHVAENARQVNRAADRLAATAGQASEATKQVATVIQQVALGAHQHAISTARMTEAAGQAHLMINTIVTNAKAVAEGAQTAATAAENGVAAATNNLAGMTAIKQKVGTSAEVVRAMEQRMQQVGLIVETIEGIAEQTNLLALNATIEAARAGEQGRGFTIVAEEVRKLAERSAVATKEINALVGGIQRAMTETVRAMKESTEQVEQGMQLTGQSGSALQRIFAVTPKVAEQVSEILIALQSMGVQIDALMAGIENVASVSEENSASAEEVAASTQELHAQVDDVTQATSDLRGMAEKLHNLLTRFGSEPE